MKPISLILLICYALGCGQPMSDDFTRSEAVPISIDFQGVWTNPNASSKVPAGAARYAQNLVNPRPGVATTVAGMQELTGSYNVSDERLSAAINYDGLIVEHTSGATPRLYRRDVAGPSLTLYSTAVSPPGGVERIPMAVAGDKLYMATSEGLRVVDGSASEPAKVGLPPPFAPYYAIPGSLGVAFEPAANESVAYRAEIRRRDSNNVYIVSVPSGRTVVTNTSAGVSAIITKNYLPTGLTAGDEFRLYRTGVAAAGVDPGDTMFLVHVAFLTAGEVSARYHEWTDSTPDALRGEALYTNAAQGGTLRQNDRPPFANELIAFDDFLVTANVRGPQRFTLRLLANPSNGDVLTIAGQTFTGSTVTEDPLNGIFMIDTTSPTVSTQIRNTSLSLILAINRKTTNTSVFAYYSSGNADPPGIIGIEAREITLTTFTTVASANGDRYEPPITAAQSSLATTEPNGIWFSKRGTHYAFPPLRSGTATYRIRVGNSGRAILKLAKLRNNLFAFVEREGVWKIQRTGAETWRVDQINNNAHLLVPESVAVVDNQVIAWTTRGVVAIDETGVEEIDLPIKDQFEAIRVLGTDVVLPYTFAVADEGRLRYILYHPESASDTTATHAWVYNADQGTWTERTDDASGGFIGEDDGLLYLGAPTAPKLYQERTGNAAAMYKRPDNTAIPVRLKLTTQDEGAPSRPKQYTDFFLLTREAITGSATFTFTNDFSGSESCTGSTSNSGEPFIHVWVPDGCQRTSRLEVDIQRNVLGQAFEVVGVELYAAGTYKGGLMR
jgi:hypothetical protein